MVLLPATDAGQRSNDRLKARKAVSFLGEGLVAREAKVDLCVIGAGQAGIGAAMDAAALGASVVLIKAGTLEEKSRLWAPLATQALAASARRAHDIRTARDMGIGADEPRINFARLNARVKDVLAQAAPDLSTERLTAMGVEVLEGAGAFEGPSRFKLGERIIRSRRFIVATGSRPFVPDIPGLSASGYYTPETALDITRRPSHLVVLGGGGTGLALAQAYLRLGCQVTLIDMLEPLADQDPELARVVRQSLEAEGLVIHANTGIVSVRADDNGVAITVKSGADETDIAASHLLVATGRIANLEGLGLDKTRVSLGAFGPVLNRNLTPSNRKIYFIGEDAEADQSVHAARMHARQIAGAGFENRRPIVPTMVHTDPQIAQVGMTEPEAAKRFKGRFAVTRAPFSQTARARAQGALAGHVKLITQTNGKIVGAGIVGGEGGELAGVFALAIARGLTLDQLDAVVAPHPSYAQVISDLGEHYRFAHPPGMAKQRSARLKRLLPW